MVQMMELQELQEQLIIRMSDDDSVAGNKFKRNGTISMTTSNSAFSKDFNWSRNSPAELCGQPQCENKKS